MQISSETSFGQYKIINQIGVGGMGEVFLAEDTRLERKVALKILPEKFSSDSEPLRRFRQEAKAASALNHPNIITVYEIGEHENTNFIATEYINGKTLRERMKERLTFDEILSIVIQTAEALSAAHEAGIVHRDIKPENIMIRSDGYVKVLDFGLAKLTENNNEKADAEEATRKLVKTNPGVVMGTVAYMSPEQARGKPVDARSDVFSFGIVLYEMLTGKTPFAGETMADVISAVIGSEPAPLAASAPHLPKELNRIVNKTLKKKREQRYQTSRDLLTDLKELRDELHLEAKLEQTAVPENTQANQQPRVSTNTSGSHLKDALLIADFENLTGDAIFDQTLKTALTFALAQSPFLEIVPENKIAQTLKLSNRAPGERITRELASEICLRQGLKAFIAGTISNLGTIYMLTLEAVNAATGESIGRQFEQANSKEEVLAALSRAATGIRETLGESLGSIEKFDVPFDLTTSSLEALKFYILGRRQTLFGKYYEAIPFYKKALELDADFASAYSGLCIIYSNIGRGRMAAEYAAKAFELVDTVSENEKLRITYFYHQYFTGEINKAIDTLELWRKTYPSEAVAYVNLAVCLGQTGQFEKAIQTNRAGLKLDQNYLTAMSNLSEDLINLNRFKEAKEVCLELIERKADNSETHRNLYYLGVIEADERLMAEQLKWFEGRPEEHLVLFMQAGAAGFRGQWRKAQDFSRRAAEIAKIGDDKENAARYAAEQALRIVFWSAGAGLPAGDEPQLKTILKTQTSNALKLSENKETVNRAALALACAGQTAETERLMEKLRAERPADTLNNQLWFPAIRAALELQSGRAKEAIEELEIAERFEKAGEFYPQYIRALAFFKLNKTKDTVREFDKILNHRGEAALSSVFPLAQLGKARALKDKAGYEKFFELWKDADKDMPALIEAKKEYDKLNG